MSIMKECHRADRWVVKMLFKLLLAFLVFLVISGILCYLTFYGVELLLVITRIVIDFLMNDVVGVTIKAFRFAMK